MPTDGANAGSSPLESNAEDDDYFDFNLDFMWRSDDEETDDRVTDAEDDEPEVCTILYTAGFRGCLNKASG